MTSRDSDVTSGHGKHYPSSAMATVAGQQPLPEISASTRAQCVALAKRVPMEESALAAEQAKAAALVASKMASAVRQLEDRRLRIEKSISATEAVMGLRSCVAGVEGAISRDDLPEACSFVEQFRSMECAAEAGGEAYETEVASMRLATARVNQLVRERYFEACAARDDEGIDEWLALLKPLGLVNEACAAAFLEYFRHLLREAVSASLSSDDEKLTTLQRVINGVAGCVKKKLQASATLSKAAAERVVLLAHDACEASTLAVVARFASEKCLASLAAQARREEMTVEEAELDDILEDVATVLQRLETWERFIKHSALTTLGSDKLLENTRLAQAAAEMAGWYSSLETYILGRGLQTAQDMDDTKLKATTAQAGLERVEGAIVSTAADDAFYAVRQSTMRAVSTGHVGAASSVLFEVNDLLQSKLLHTLSTRAHAAIAACSASTFQTTQFAKKQIEKALKGFSEVLPSKDAAEVEADEGAESRIPRQCQIAVNTLERACELLAKLRGEVEDEIDASYGIAQRPQLIAVLEDLDVRDKFLNALATALEALATTLLVKPLLNAATPKVPTSVDFLINPTVDFDDSGLAAPAIKIHRYAIDERAFEALERADDFAFKLSASLDDLVPCTTALLSPANRLTVGTALAKNLANNLEQYVVDSARSRQLTSIGAIQLDRDVRTLRACLSAKFERSAVRDALADLQAKANLLASQDGHDVAYYLDTFTKTQLLDIVKLRQWTDHDRTILQNALEKGS